MLQQFKCGCVKTCGMWKDDFIFKVSYICKECESKLLQAEFRTVRIGRKVLVVKRAKGSL